MNTKIFKWSIFSCFFLVAVFSARAQNKYDTLVPISTSYAIQVCVVSQHSEAERRKAIDRIYPEKEPEWLPSYYKGASSIHVFTDDVIKISLIKTESPDQNIGFANPANIYCHGHHGMFNISTVEPMGKYNEYNVMRTSLIDCSDIDEFQCERVINWPVKYLELSKWPLTEEVSQLNKVPREELEAYFKGCVNEPCFMDYSILPPEVLADMYLSAVSDQEIQNLNLKLSFYIYDLDGPTVASYLAFKKEVKKDKAYRKWIRKQ